MAKLCSRRLICTPKVGGTVLQQLQTSLLESYSIASQVHAFMDGGVPALFHFTLFRSLLPFPCSCLTFIQRLHALVDLAHEARCQVLNVVAPLLTLLPVS